MASEFTSDELKVLRRLAKGPTSSVDRSNAFRLQKRGLVGQVPMVSWTFCITDAGRKALMAQTQPLTNHERFNGALPDSFAA